MDAKIVFVYSCDGGALKRLKESLKRAGGSKDCCRLRMLTHDRVRMKPKWKKYMDSQRIGIRMMQEDEFSKEYPDINPDAPCGYHIRGEKSMMMASKVEIEACQRLEDLIWLCSERIRKIA